VAAAFIIMAVVFGHNTATAGDPYGTCAQYGVAEHQCFCDGTQKRICSSGYVWDPASNECTSLSCGDPPPPPPPPKINVPGKTKPKGISEKRTPKVGDPVSAAGGEFREYWTLLSLGGPIPLEFTLAYAPDLVDKIPTSDGRVQFPPNDALKAFTSNAVLRLVEFTDKGVSPNIDYVNILLFDDLLVFRYDTVAAAYVPAGPVRYELKKTADGRYFLMDPETELIYQFRSRALAYERTSPRQAVQRVGEIESIIDRNANVISYTYNANHLPTMIKDEGSDRVLNLTYDGNGHLSRVADGYGRLVIFKIETMVCKGLPWNGLKYFSDAMGQRTTFIYDTSTYPCYLLNKIERQRGNSHIDQVWADNPEGVKGVSSQKDANGHETTLSWIRDDSGNLTTTVIYPDGARQVFSSEDQRYPLSLKDPENQTISMGYTDDRRLSRITDTLGFTTAMTYHPQSGKLASITNAEGKTTAYTYTAQTQFFAGDAVTFTFHDLTRTDYPDGTFETFAYDAKGNVTRRTDRKGNAWTFTHNARGQVLTATNPLGGVETFTYNDDGAPASAKDSDTGVTLYGYDDHKRPNKVTHPDGTFLQIAYNANDRIVSVTDENNRTSRYTYNSNGYLAIAEDPSGNFTTYDYDNMDRVKKITDKLGKITTLTFDNRGRPASLQDPDAVTTTYGYDAYGRQSSIARGNAARRTVYDSEGLPVSSRTPLDHQTRYETDRLGNLTAITDPAGSRLVLTRNAMGQLTGIIDGLDRHTAYAYDAAGRLSGVTLPEIGGAGYERNVLGLISRITDLNGRDWNLSYTTMGRLQSLTDPLSKTWQYAYDNRGRLNRVTFPDETTKSITYDGVGNIVQAAHSAGPTLSFGYDDLQRLTSTANLTLTRDAEGRVLTTSDGEASFTAAYTDGGRLQKLAVAANDDRFEVTYAYNAVTGLLESVSDSLTQTVLTFTYDADRNLTAIGRPNGVNTRYDYDAAGRLIRIREGAFLDAAYTLDAAGQVVRADMTLPLDPTSAVGDGAESFTYDAASQIASSGYEYDIQGRLILAPGLTLTWNGASRLTAIGSVQMVYNGMGDLVTRSDGAATTRFSYSYSLWLHPIVAERNTSGPALARYYVWTPDGRLLYLIDRTNGSKVYHYHFDRTGSTVALTDGTGAMTDAYAYDAYGRILRRTGAGAQPFTFAGQWGIRRENATLYQARARYYDAATGRFLSREPLWPQTDDPRLLNPYAYARGNPVLEVDVTGREPSQPGNITPVHMESGGGQDSWTAAIHNSIETAIVKKSYSLTDKGRRFGVKAGNEHKKDIEAERERNRKIGKKANVIKFAKPLFVHVADEGDRIVVLIIDRRNNLLVVKDMFEIGKKQLEAGEPNADFSLREKLFGSDVKRVEGNNPVADAFVDKVAESVKRHVDDAR
jgi:RHS repeat-associated protein